jgi:aryl-alcohol dehydrogenase-like predicted oxidoreductase
VRVRRLGETDLHVTEVCLGSMPFGNRVDERTAFAIMDVAYAAGVRFFDTADVYPPPSTPDLQGRSELIVGSWLKRRGLRSQVVLATKVGKPMWTSDRSGLSRASILRACDESLRRLQTSWIDLYLAHVPDSATPVEETLSALHELIQVGKVRCVGCSNFPPAQLVQWLRAGQSLSLPNSGALQERYNLLTRDAEHQTLPLCSVYGVGVIAYSPLAGGLLTGRHAALQPVTDPTARLRRLTAEYGHSLTQVALSWVLSRPAIASTVVGASHPEQLQDSLSGEALTLDPHLMEAVEDIVSKDREH